jgi:FMN phosphatase YigB (HAD superfamily)
MKIQDVKIILCDIDSTVTEAMHEDRIIDFRNVVFEMFSRHIAASRKIGGEEARSALEDMANNVLVWWDYPDLISSFGLDPVLIWKEMRRIHKDVLHVYPDAVEMVKYLKAANKNLYIISNNPVTGCLLKLEAAGLASLLGSDYFSRIFGTNITRGMKSQVPMWKRVIASLGEEPENIITIGDHVKEDFEIPNKAGIRYSIIVDRTSKEPVSEQNGYIRVNSLSMVKEVVK